MSFFKRLFRAPSTQERIHEADDAFTRGDFGRAKLAYEAVLAKPDATSPESMSHCRIRVSEARDALAARHLEEAKLYLERGDFELARTELEHASELAASEALASRARLEIMKLQNAAEIRAHGAAPTNIDVWEAFSAAWDDDQREEYDALGEDFKTAVMALHDGDAARGREIMEKLVAGAKEPRFLWLEAGRARLATNDLPAANAAFLAFLARADSGSAIEARIVAHSELARLAEERGDVDAAIAQLERAIDEAPDDPRPFALLGVLLRREGHADAAVEVLESAVSLLEDARPDVRVLEELGLAYVALGTTDGDARAVRELEGVLSIYLARGQLDFPEAPTAALATIHEKEGRVARAADLYRNLAHGAGDRAKRAKWSRETARVLRTLNLEADAVAMEQRATMLEITRDED